MKVNAQIGANAGDRVLHKVLESVREVLYRVSSAALREEWTSGRLTAVQTINHPAMASGLQPPLSVSVHSWDTQENTFLRHPEMDEAVQDHCSLPGRPPSQRLDKVLLLYCAGILRGGGFYCYWHWTPDSHLGEKSPLDWTELVKHSWSQSSDDEDETVELLESLCWTPVMLKMYFK